MFCRFAICFIFMQQNFTIFIANLGQQEEHMIRLFGMEPFASSSTCWTKKRTPIHGIRVTTREKMNHSSFSLFFSSQINRMKLFREKKKTKRETQKTKQNYRRGCAVTVLSRCDLKVVRNTCVVAVTMFSYTVQAQKCNNKHTEPLLNIIRLARPFTDYYRLLHKCWNIKPHINYTQPTFLFALFLSSLICFCPFFLFGVALAAACRQLLLLPLPLLLMLLLLWCSVVSVILFAFLLFVPSLSPAVWWFVRILNGVFERT